MRGTTRLRATASNQCVSLALHASLLHGEHMPKTAFLTSPEVAALAKVSPRTVQRAAKAGDLPPAQKLGGPNGAFLFSQDAVDAYLASRSTAA